MTNFNTLFMQGLLNAADNCIADLMMKLPPVYVLHKAGLL